MTQQGVSKVTAFVWLCIGFGLWVFRDVVHARDRKAAQGEKEKAVVSEESGGERVQEARTAYSGQYCQSNEDLYPGRWVDGRWEPEKCQFYYFSKGELKTCFRENMYTSVGDSLNLQNKFYLDTVHIDTKHIWNPSAAYGYFTMDQQLKEDYADHLLQARYVTISMGMWDVGVHHCGTDFFYDGLKMKVMRYKAMVQGVVSLWDLHWVAPDRCGDKWFCKCQDAEKVSVYREIIQQVAACTNTTIINATPMTRANPLYTGDGVHYGMEVTKAKINLIASFLCPPERGAPRLALTVPSMKCDEEAYKAKWRQSIIANSHLPGCGESMNKFGCPNDGGAAAARYRDKYLRKSNSSKPRTGNH
eukprot:TRINITY_DN6932_c0_g1_i1.p1 TRINITY_DN6932_c0_g1~~TRINITY_DN6932_c0_g1_i1.p1  ORF type:complete len:360 (+),score=107.90 TRINITY_DN6932_c0_g1_i1:24-1103(+)